MVAYLPRWLRGSNNHLKEFIASCPKCLSRDLVEVSMAKASAAEAFKRVALFGLKIHGGAGYMEDHDMSLYFRRAQTAVASFGNADFHRGIVSSWQFSLRN